MEINPKDKYVQETKALTQSSRDMRGQEIVSVCGLEIAVFPEVFNPHQFFSSCWFAKEISGFLKEENATDFCEIGSGTGILSLYVAQHNPEIRIVSCDINANAVANTKANLERYNIERVDVLESNVFSGLSGRKFDVVFWALPFGYVEEGTVLDNVDLQTFDAGYSSIEEYFRNGSAYLNKEGVLLFGFSPEIGHLELIEQFSNKYHWSLKLMSEEEGTEKSIVKMQIYAAQPL